MHRMYGIIMRKTTMKTFGSVIQGAINVISSNFTFHGLEKEAAQIL